jgi:acetoin utilization deacetylase AcuC-like enzyme
MRMRLTVSHADRFAGGRVLGMGGGGYNRANLGNAWTRVVEELAA